MAQATLPPPIPWRRSGPTSDGRSLGDPGAGAGRRAGRLRLAVAFILISLALLVASAAIAAPTFPKLTGRVVDEANLLSAQTEAQLTAQLADLEQKSSDQLVVVTLSSLQGYEIEDYGYQLGRAWGIGQKGQNNGVLLIVAPSERRVRIEVGYGLEGILTDALASTIIQAAVLPRFRAGDMEGGVVAGAEALIQQLALDPAEAAARAAEAARTRPAPESEVDPLVALIVILVIFFVLQSAFRRAARAQRRSPWRSAAGMGLPPVIITDWGRGGGFGGGFGGGGGSFGGGGSSGGW
jgi:uncharacterized protein